MNSREKGKRGEREFRDVLREAGYLKAHRGQQFHGGSDSPDVNCPELPSLHFEVKRCQKGNPYDWVEQAEHDAGTFFDGVIGKRFKLAVVAHKRNNMPWIAVLKMSDFLEIVRRSDLPT